MKNRHIRTCLSCGGKFKQSGLARFFLDEYQVVRPDCGGKAPGRGAYSCKKIDCLEAFFKSKKRLARAFRSETIDGVAGGPLEIEKLLGSGSFR